MDRAVLSTLLEGGYIEQYSFDMRLNAVAVRVSVLDGETLSIYHLCFHRVSQFSFETETRRGTPDDSLQVTEFLIDCGPEASGTEEWSVSINMWDASFLRIHCSAFIVDDEAVA
jgi:hypothetical protein